jgi:hypothetical protein
VSEWHPILAAVELEPGRWTMVDPAGREYGLIEIRRTPDGIRYHCEHRGEEIGWATSLKVACERVHYAYIRSHSPASGAAAFGQYQGTQKEPPA